MTLRLKFLRETEKARLYEFKDGCSLWIPRSVVKSTMKMRDANDNPVHELNIEDWWWDKWEKQQEEESQ